DHVAGAGTGNGPAEALPDVAMDGRAADPAGRLKRFIREFPGRVLICAESSGRREALIENLGDHKLKLATVSGWQEFLEKSDATLAITIAPMEQGMVLRSEERRVGKECG